MSQFFVLNIAAATFFIGFFISDVILSRAVFAVGAAVFVYGLTLNEGNFLALAWAMIFLLTNLGVIWLTLQRRNAVPLSDEAKALAKEMPQFSKKDFARLMQIGDWQTLDAEQKLTEQGAPVEALYYIVTGGATVAKNDKSIEVGADLLIGEISLMQKAPATATVHAHKGSVLVAWPVRKLNKLLKRKSLKAGFDALLSHDLAEKLAADELREQNRASK
jgi:hypothetical protein